MLKVTLTDIQAESLRGAEFPSPLPRIQEVRGIEGGYSSLAYPAWTCSRIGMWGSACCDYESK
jgi:hypothetical protein